MWQRVGVEVVHEELVSCSYHEQGGGNGDSDRVWHMEDGNGGEHTAENLVVATHRCGSCSIPKDSIQCNDALMLCSLCVVCLAFSYSTVHVSQRKRSPRC